MASIWAQDRRICVRIPEHIALEMDALMQDLKLRTWSRLVRVALQKLREATPWKSPIKTSDNRSAVRQPMPLFDRTKKRGRVKGKKPGKRRAKVA